MKFMDRKNMAWTYCLKRELKFIEITFRALLVMTNLPEMHLINMSATYRRVKFVKTCCCNHRSGGAPLQNVGYRTIFWRLLLKRWPQHDYGKYEGQKVVTKWTPPSMRVKLRWKPIGHSHISDKDHYKIKEKRGGQLWNQRLGTLVVNCWFVFEQVLNTE